MNKYLFEVEIASLHVRIRLANQEIIQEISLKDDKEKIRKEVIKFARNQGASKEEMAVIRKALDRLR